MYRKSHDEHCEVRRIVWGQLSTAQGLGVGRSAPVCISNWIVAHFDISGMCKRKYLWTSTRLVVFCELQEAEQGSGTEGSPAGLTGDEVKCETKILPNGPRLDRAPGSFTWPVLPSVVFKAYCSTVVMMLRNI